MQFFSILLFTAVKIMAEAGTVDPSGSIFRGFGGAKC